MNRLLFFFLSVVLSFDISQADEVRIGILTDLSGGMASWGYQARIGAEIAVDEIEKKGGKIKVFWGDHQLQAKNAVTEFLKLVEFDKVDAIYSEFTPTSVAIAPIAKTKKMPVIYSAAATSPIKSAPYIFKTYLDFVEGCKKVGEFWKAQEISNVAILKANLEFGELCHQGLKQVFPQAIELAYNPGDDVSTQLLVLKSKGVAAILNPAFEPDFLRMLKSIQSLNWNPVVATQDDAMAKETRELFPQMLITVFALPGLPSEFIEQIKAKDSSNSLVSISAAGLAYLHVKQLYSARSKCSANDINCMQREIENASSDNTIGFTQWKDQIAAFKISLRTWQQGREVEQLQGSTKSRDKRI